MESLGIGFSNLVNSNRIIAIVSPETNPIKRIVQRRYFWKKNQECNNYGFKSCCVELSSTRDFTNEIR